MLEAENINITTIKYWKIERGKSKKERYIYILINTFTRMKGRKRRLKIERKRS